MAYEARSKAILSAYGALPNNKNSTTLLNFRSHNSTLYKTQPRKDNNTQGEGRIESKERTVTYS